MLHTSHDVHSEEFSDRPIERSGREFCASGMNIGQNLDVFTIKNDLHDKITVLPNKLLISDIGYVNE